MCAYGPGRRRREELRDHFGRQLDGRRIPHAEVWALDRQLEEERCRGAQVLPRARWFGSLPNRRDRSAPLPKISDPHLG